ncbi:MAG: hypothetical protein PHY15_07100 [Eubacteriales bacterium]|nr:hypothetical protein [Eubacteriales bacterium]MDD4476056.1 hypothetical protein [Eubacteriales bacterium]
MFDIFFIVFLFFHVMVCLIMLLLIKLDVLKISMQLYPLITFLPFWGVFMTLKADYYLRKNKTGSREIELEKLIMDPDDYRSLTLAVEETDDSVVPLEEAILINDSETRRQLMIDVLKHDPKQYVKLLQSARENDDVEVAHYASTAIMEIQREYELHVKDRENEYKRNPDNLDAIDSYRMAVREYVNSGLIQDSVLYLQRQKYDSILSKRLEMPGADMKIYHDAIDNLLEMEIYQRASLLIETALKKWPTNEELWLIRVKYIHLTGDRKNLEETITKLKKSSIYFSPSAQASLEYWIS